jgi:iron complex outermembrane receptor protein
VLTRRSLDLQDGLSGALRLQGSNGSITKTTDPEISGLMGWKANDDLAMSLAFSYGDSTLASNQGRLRTDRVAESWECGEGACQDLDGNGDTSGDFFSPMNWQSPEFSSR